MPTHTATEPLTIPFRKMETSTILHLALKSALSGDFNNHPPAEYQRGRGKSLIGNSPMLPCYGNLQDFSSSLKHHHFYIPDQLVFM